MRDGDDKFERANIGSSPTGSARPFFAYGTLKPGELAYELISDDVGHCEDATVKGYLWVRDGIPILDTRADDTSVQGSLIWFKSNAGYQQISNFEPSEFYRWASVTSDSGVEANTLVAVAGLQSDRGGGDILWEPWQTAFDPLFRFALSTVAATIRADGRSPLRPTDDDPESWARYYRIQSSYLLACSILERIAFLVVGAGDDVSARINKLGRNADFVESVTMVGLANLGRRVFKSGEPTKRPVSLNEPRQFAQWAYQIRSNMVHRGKSSWREAELVRTALIDLHDVLRVYLLKKLPAIRDAWEKCSAADSATDWRIKPTIAGD